MIDAQVTAAPTGLYSLLSYQLALRTTIPQIERLFAGVFAEFAVPADRVEPEALHEYEVVPDGAGVTLCRDGDPIRHVSSWPEAYGLLEWSVTQAALNGGAAGVALHAAALARGGRCLLLVGPSGAGKSTLALAMLEAGFAYMSDEASILTPRGEVIPFPRALALNSGGPAAALNYLPGRVYLPPAQLGYPVVRGSLPPLAVVLLERRPGLTSSLERISRQEALPRLLEQVYTCGPAEVVLGALASLLSRVAPVCLQMGAAADAAMRLGSLFEQLEGCA